MALLSTISDLLRQESSSPWLTATRERLLAGSHRFFVTSAFRGLLNRGPDKVGQKHFVDALNRGSMTREAVLRQLGRSPEGAQLMLLGPGFRVHVEDFCAAREEVPEGIRPLFFFHVMKCGGTAFAHGLSTLAEPWPRLIDVWIDQLVCMPRPILNRAMLVTGHLPYGARGVLAPDTATCTILREPVSRTLSHFTHLRTHGHETDLTIEDFLCTTEWRRHWVNYQATQLAVDVPIDDAWLGLPFGARTLQSLIDGVGEITEAELVDRALGRLAEIELVGVNDRLDDLLGSVAAFWDKPPPPPLTRMNTSLQPMRVTDLPDRLRSVIVEGTRADEALYEAARERVAH